VMDAQLTRRCSRPAAAGARGQLAHAGAAGLLSGRIVRQRSSGSAS